MGVADKDTAAADDQSIAMSQRHGTILVDEQKVEKTYHHNLDADDALAFVQAHGVTEITPEEDKRILRKIDMWLMPIMLITNTLNFMDKNAMSNSANFGLETDMHLTSNQYSWASGSIFYLTYLVAQPFVSRSLQYFPIGPFMSISVVLWGVTLMTIAACRSFAAVMTLRAILGVFESVINPTFMLMTSMWYKRSEQPERMGWWFMGNALGQILGGIIGYGIGHIHSGLAVGDWIFYFIIFGAVTIVYGVGLYFVIPSSPMSARWLSDRDRALAVERVRLNRTGIINHHWKWYQFRECLMDVQVWVLVAVQFLTNVPSGGVASFGNIVIKGFGFSSLNTTLLQMPLGVVQGLTILVSGAFCSRFANGRAIVMVVTQIPALIGAVLLYKLPTSSKGGRLAAYYIIQTHSIISIMSWSIFTANIGGTTKKATASALLFVSFCAGQVVAPQLFIAKEAPQYPTAFKASFSCFALLIVLTIGLVLYLAWMNRTHNKEHGFIDPNAKADSTTGSGVFSGLQAAGSVNEMEEFYDLTDREQAARFRYVW